MKAAGLLAALDTIYQADQAKFQKLKLRLSELEKKRAALQTALKHDHTGIGNFQLADAACKYAAWRRCEAHKISRTMFEMDLELLEAKRKLKISFGRLEAMRELIARGEL